VTCSFIFLNFACCLPFISSSIIRRFLTFYAIDAVLGRLADCDTLPKKYENIREKYAPGVRSSDGDAASECDLKLYSARTEELKCVCKEKNFARFLKIKFIRKKHRASRRRDDDYAWLRRRS